MKYSALIIARSLIDAVEGGAAAEEACDAAVCILKAHCPQVPLRDFVRTLEKELLRRHRSSHGLLVVPREQSMTPLAIEKQLTEKAGHPVHIDRMVDPELIGGAVLNVDHQRIDCSVQGALKHLHQLCLQPLD